MQDAEERKQLIERLMKHHPYPKEWFEKLSTAQLIKMYNQPAKKKATQKRQEEAKTEEDYSKETEWRKYDEETGQWMVKSDAFGWEPEST